MIKFKINILVVFLLMFCGHAFGQKDPTKEKPEKQPKDSTEIVTPVTQSIPETLIEPQAEMLEMESVETSSNFIPPSPETQELFKFIDYPVNHSTGVPDIEIPLYTIRNGDIIVPISISYHASGRKVSDVTGSIGLGWALRCGGMISRTVYGKPDGLTQFIPETYKTANELLYDRDYDAMASVYYDSNDINSGGAVNLNNYDSEYDIFNFYCGSISGKFIYDHKHSKPVLFPKQPVKIPYASGIPSEIIDGNGFIYNFTEAQDAELNGKYTIISKYLTSISSPNNKHVTFSYQMFGWDAETSVEKYTYNDDIQVSDDIYFEQTLLQQNGQTLDAPIVNYTEKRIDGIDFECGAIEFVLEPDANRKISSIIIKDDQGDVIKTIEFHRSILDYAGSIPNYKLDSIIIKDSNNVSVEKYQFDYYPSESFSIESKDYWGYRNASDHTDLLPYYSIFSYKDNSNIDIGHLSTDREPNALFSQMGVLSKITYPTGGTSEFIFEGNKFTKLGAIANAPGLRIQQVISTDNAGKSIYKTYDYSPGFIYLYPDMKYNFSQKRVFYEFGNPFILADISDKSYNQRIGYSENQSDLSHFINQPISYGYVQEYLGTKDDNEGYISYTYSTPDNGRYGKYSPVDFVNCAHPSGGVLFNGNYPNTDSNTLPWYVVEFNLWDIANRLSTYFYKFDGYDDQGQRSYQLKKSIINNYEETKTGELSGLHLVKFSEFPKDEYNSILHEVYASECNIPVFMAADYTISLGKSELKSRDEIDYTENGQFTTTTEYIYNDKNLISKSHKQINNDEEIITTFKYPFDPDFINASPYDDMVEDNILSPVIEQIVEKDVSHLKSIKTEYFDWGNNLFKPKTIDVKNSDQSNYENELIYNSYDGFGNPTNIISKDGLYTYYLWAYNGQYPVAKIVSSNSSIELSPLQTNVDNVPFTNSDEYTNISTDVGNLQGAVNSISGNADTQISLYTYKPLVGMTSQTDPSGRTTYYEYDDFGRLEYVRDHNGNIVNRYNYHYADQE